MHRAGCVVCGACCVVRGALCVVRSWVAQQCRDTGP
jgi:hypothetical protein